MPHTASVEPAVDHSAGGSPSRPFEPGPAHTRRWIPAIVFLATCSTAGAAAQTPVGPSQNAQALAIDGPEPPTLPLSVSRDANGRVTLRAIRLVDPLRVDGVLDEELYQEIVPASEFVQQLPDEGAAATEKTEAWVFFDERHVYVGVRLWDSEPEERWIANDMRRDAIQLVNNDSFSVVFDTFYDRRNGVAFLVNPLGGFFDYEISDEGNPNNDWNPVWDVQTGRFEGGWTIEMQIPFKSIRYGPGVAQVWGVQFERRVRRRNESSFLTPVPIAARPGIFRVSSAGTLVGLEVPGRGTRFEIKPYGIASATTDLEAVPPYSGRADGDWGGDAKWGLTQNLVADFTYNTDFAQVEVDEQQVNLTRFSLFLPEKREFFLEGRGLFDFGSGPGVLGRRPGGGGRNVGVPGQGAAGGDVPLVFFSRRIGLDEGQSVPIRGGGRVIGKTGQFSIGGLNMQTEDEPAVDAQATNFTVVRVKRDILRRSRIGGIFTGRSVSPGGGGSNQAVGADAAFAFYENLYLNGYYARTATPGVGEDETSYQAALTYNGDLYGFQVDHLLVGGNFNPEVGFVRRDDIRKTFLAAQYSPRPRSIEAVRQFTWGASLDYIENLAGQLDTRAAQLRFNTEFENSDQLYVDATDNYERLEEPFEVGPGVTIPPGSYSFPDLFLSYSMGPQRRISGTAFVQVGGFYSGDIAAFGFRQGRIEITRQLYVEPTVSINRIDLPEGRFTAALVTSRVTYTFTPRMFIAGLIQYNSTGELLGTNLRFRWEYRPGSELFVVYNDQRDTTLGWAPRLENRSFVVKVTRLFRL